MRRSRSVPDEAQGTSHRTNRVRAAQVAERAPSAGGPRRPRRRRSGPGMCGYPFAPPSPTCADGGGGRLIGHARTGRRAGRSTAAAVCHGFAAGVQQRPDVAVAAVGMCLYAGRPFSGCKASRGWRRLHLPIPNVRVPWGSGRDMCLLTRPWGWPCRRAGAVGADGDADRAYCHARSGLPRT
jgi:hypothetical protein